MHAMTASDKEYQAEDDLRTMIAAEKIKQDPKRLAACMKKKRTMKKALEAIGA